MQEFLQGDNTRIGVKLIPFILSAIKLCYFYLIKQFARTVCTAVDSTG
jgi:hypothetical protein